MPVLHYEQVTAPGAVPERWLAVLPGIFGAGRNWATVARRVARARPEWGMLLVDLRQHGRSQGFAPPHTVAAAAADLPPAFAAAALPISGVLGHSFGGKVALELARTHAAELGLRSVWTVDSPPGAREPEGSAWAMLGALRRAPGPFARRDDGVAALMEQGVAEGVARWMSTNLEDAAGGLVWRVAADDMEALLRDFFRRDLWTVLEAPPADVEIHVVKAEESSALDEPACDRVEAAAAANGQVRLHRVAGGHWVNADNPDAIVDLLGRHLP